MAIDHPSLLKRILFWIGVVYSSLFALLILTQPGAWPAYLLLVGVGFPTARYAIRHWDQLPPPPVRRRPTETNRKEVKPEKPRPSSKPEAKPLPPEPMRRHSTPPQPVSEPLQVKVTGPYCLKCRNPMEGNAATELRCPTCRWGVRVNEKGERESYSWAAPPKPVEPGDLPVRAHAPSLERIVETPFRLHQAGTGWMPCPKCGSNNMFIRTFQAGSAKKPAAELYECHSCGHVSRNQP